MPHPGAHDDGDAAPAVYSSPSDTAETPSAAEYSTSASAYAASQSRDFQRTTAVERAPGLRLAIVAVVLISLLANVAVALTQVLPSSPETAIVLGVIVVVLLGAGGLACRGVGELRNSAGWKAAGCFLCAAAYLGTATVALVNGVPLLFES